MTALIGAIWAGLFFSFSQSSFAALIAGVLAAAAIAWRRQAAFAVALAAVVVVAVGMAAPQVRNALFSDSGPGLNRATSGRFELVREGTGIALDHPVAGVGIGGFKRAFADRTGLAGKEPRRAASHNTPVTVAAETGIPGLLLLGWLVAAALYTAWRRLPRSFAGRSSLAFGLMLAAIGVHSLFYNAFFEDPMVWVLFGLIPLGAAVILREEAVPVQQPVEVTPPRVLAPKPVPQAQPEPVE